jgi:hypothetical protein
MLEKVKKLGFTRPTPRNRNRRNRMAVISLDFDSFWIGRLSVLKKG